MFAFVTYLSNPTIEWLVPLLHTHELRGLILGQVAGYPDLSFRLFSSLSPAKWWDSQICQE
jgi:hypothetical protein